MNNLDSAQLFFIAVPRTTVFKNTSVCNLEKGVKYSQVPFAKHFDAGLHKTKALAFFTKVVEELCHSRPSVSTSF